MVLKRRGGHKRSFDENHEQTGKSKKHDERVRTRSEGEKKISTRMHVNAIVLSRNKLVPHIGLCYLPKVLPLDFPTNGDGASELLEFPDDELWSVVSQTVLHEEIDLVE